MENKKVIFITWETHRRSQNLAKQIGIPLYEIEYDRFSPLFRYVISLIRTFLIFVTIRPKVVICQNPSLILALFATIVKPLFGYILVVDAHNAGVINDKERPLINKILKFIHHYTDITIVTNTGLIEEIEKNKGRGFILQDALPQIETEKIGQCTLEGNFRIAFICTFHSDEPYVEVLSAMEQVPEDIHIYITGKAPEAVKNKKMKSNIHLLGFIPEKEFWAILKEADVIMDLTTRENCLVCGAYEAVALKKPLILSNTKALKEYFNLGAVYINSDVDSIYNGILDAQRLYKQLKTDAITLNGELPARWNALLQEFQEKVNQLAQIKFGCKVF
jgi:glycosyltransferase involved in cell wall biosynthesis